MASIAMKWNDELMFSSEMYIGNDPHLKTPGVVGEGVLPVPVGVLYLVPPAGQQQLVWAVERCWVNGVAIDQAHQVLPVMLPRNQHTTKKLFIYQVISTINAS